MSEPSKSPGAASWWRGVKGQFQRIIWPTREDVAKQSALAIAVSVFLGLLIAIFDNVLIQIIDWIIRF